MSGYLVRWILPSFFLQIKTWEKEKFCDVLSYKAFLQQTWKDIRNLFPTCSLKGWEIHWQQKNPTRTKDPRSIKLCKPRTLVINLQNLQEDTGALPLGRKQGVFFEIYYITREILWCLQELSQNLIPEVATSRGGSRSPPSSKCFHQVTELPERIHSIGQRRHFSAKMSVEPVILLGSIS